MGMYDEIRVLHPAMPLEWRDRVLQTKDLDCDMTSYVVTADGQLLRSHDQSPHPFTGEVDAHDFDGDFRKGAPLLDWRMKFVRGHLKSLKGPCDLWVADFGSMPELLSRPKRGKP